MLCLDFRVIQETAFSQRWQAISVCKSCQVQGEHVLQPQTNGWSSFFQVNMFLFNESAASKVSLYCWGTEMFSGLFSNLGRFCFQSVILKSLLEKRREKETACVCFHSTVNSANTGRNCCLLSNLWTQAGETWSSFFVFLRAGLFIYFLAVATWTFIKRNHMKCRSCSNRKEYNGSKMW